MRYLESLASALLPSLATALLAATLPAENLGGGVKASTGKRPILKLTRWIPGKTGHFSFTDFPGPIGLILLSDKVNRIPVPGIGTFVADITSPAFVVLGAGTAAPIPIPIPQKVNGVELIMQGAFFEGSALKLTDATRVSFFNPLATVGCQRANTYSVIDIPAHRVAQTLTGTNNGSLLFTPDGKRAYSNEHGSGRTDHIKVYDTSKRPIVLLTRIPLTGGIRYQSAMPRDGRRLYVPMHDRIVEIDTDPTSTNYHKVLRSFPTKIKGISAGIGAGPLACAVTPNGLKLYIAYGMLLNYPAKGTIGMIHTKIPNFTEVSIPVTTGGTFLGTSSRDRIAMSPDGRHVVALEYGIPKGLAQFYKGFLNGALINVIDTGTDKEVAFYATQGYDRGELAFERSGRQLWVTAPDGAQISKLLRVDIDPDSVTAWRRSWFTLDPIAYAGGGGVLGCDVTPDGSRVLVCLEENSKNHATPVARVFDALSNKLVGTPITVGSLPRTVSIEQR
ncbi:MAG: YncE family protein [Planctomycetota bacterium]